MLSGPYADTLSGAPSRTIQHAEDGLARKADATVQTDDLNVALDVANSCPLPV